jgi:tetratricopeptide (TPR) repeat protein
VLVPALGFFNVYYMRYAYVSDHFQYHASLALIVLVAAAATLAAARLGPRSKLVATMMAGVLLAELAALTIDQTFAYWDIETLYRDTIAKNPAAWMAYGNLAGCYEARDEYSEALELRRKALELSSQVEQNHFLIGRTLVEISDRDASDRSSLAEAIGHFQNALELRPDYLAARRALGLAFHKAGRDADALYQESLAISSAPDDAETLCAMGTVLRGVQKPDDAERYLQRALAARPKYPDALVGLAMAQADQGKLLEATKSLETALGFDPWSATRIASWAMYP